MSDPLLLRYILVHEALKAPEHRAALRAGWAVQQQDAHARAALLGLVVAAWLDGKAPWDDNPLFLDRWDWIEAYLELKP